MTFSDFMYMQEGCPVSREEGRTTKLAQEGVIFKKSEVLELIFIVFFLIFMLIIDKESFSPLAKWEKKGKVYLLQ